MSRLAEISKGLTAGAIVWASIYIATCVATTRIDVRGPAHRAVVIPYEPPEPQADPCDDTDDDCRAITCRHTHSLGRSSS